MAWAKSVFEQLFVQDAVLLGQFQDIARSSQTYTIEQRSNSVTAWLKTLSDEQVMYCIYRILLLTSVCIILMCTMLYIFV